MSSKKQIGKTILSFAFFTILFISFFCTSLHVIGSNESINILYYGTIFESSLLEEPQIEKNIAYEQSIIFRDYIYNKTSSINLDITNRERIHMQDVKELYANILSLLKIFILNFIWIAILIFAQQKVNYSKWIKKQRKVIWAVYGSFSVTIVTAIWKFDDLFRLIHKPFFSNDYWLLPYNSITIQTFPTSYFAFICALAILLTLLLMWITTILVPKLRQHV